MSLKEEKEPIRQGANVDFNLDDEEDDGFSLQDIEVNSNKEGSKKTSKIKDFIAKKKEEVSGFNAKDIFGSGNKMQIFSMEEFKSDKRKVMIKAALGELVVTTLFIFIVCAQGLNVSNSGHGDSEALVVSALTTGFSAVALIYSFADVSGAHFNPAVTFATFVTGKTTAMKAITFVASQLVGSMFAMALLAIAYPMKVDPVTNNTYSVPQQLVISPGDNTSPGSAFFMEMMLSFILVYVIFATAFDTVDNQSSIKILDDKGNVTDQKHAKSMTIYTASGNSKAGFAPLSIGLTLGFLCFLGGSISGGAFNPARVFGSAICAGDFSYNWLYWIADLMGAAFAGLLQQHVFASEKPKN